MAYRPFLLVLPLLIVSGPADAEESKLNCTQVKSHQCKAKPDGTLYDCKDVLVDKCTVVAGPGSGKALEVVTDTPGGTSKVSLRRQNRTASCKLGMWSENRSQCATVSAERAAMTA